MKYLFLLALGGASEEVCWKCDSMGYSDCAAFGKYTPCGLGEADACFYEIREVNGKLELTTGCKQAEACEILQNENFLDVSNVDSLNDQCNPRYEFFVLG